MTGARTALCRVVLPLNRFLTLANEEKKRVLGISPVQFAISGYDATSLNLLLKKLGLSTGKLFNPFADEADVFFTVMQEDVDALRLGVDDRGHPTSATDYRGHGRA